MTSSQWHTWLLLLMISFFFFCFCPYISFKYSLLSTIYCLWYKTHDCGVAVSPLSLTLCFLFYPSAVNPSVFNSIHQRSSQVFSPRLPFKSPLSLAPLSSWESQPALGSGLAFLHLLNHVFDSFLSVRFSLRPLPVLSPHSLKKKKKKSHWA